MNKLAITIGALSLLGCGPTLKYKGIGEARPPKPLATCQFKVLTAPPSDPYEELGMIDIQYDNTGYIYKAEDLAKKIRPEVCKAGGDAVLGHANTYGTFLKATVLGLPAKPPAEAISATPEASGSEAPTQDASVAPDKPTAGVPPEASDGKKPKPAASAAPPASSGGEKPKPAASAAPAASGSKKKPKD